ncbi:MAG TPA: NAD kinase [Amoebophilaceae bacterium]|nr:NAD kinase [Amoebophilaceae bacterium]
MRVALHGKNFSKDTFPFIDSLLHALIKYEAHLFVSQPLHTLLQSSTIQLPTMQPLVQVKDFMNLELIISLGGDGTLLEAVSYAGASETPILGINTGRMGFLATVAQKDALAALKGFWEGQYVLDKRTLLRLDVCRASRVETDFALNEVAFLKRDSSSMIAVHASINGELRTKYWADGLIVTTPTGSTGYSLSCGGPIVLPSAHNLVITPVNPHNLSVRPLVLPDSAVLSFKVESRNQKFLVTLDGRSRATNTDAELTVRKAPFQTHLIKIDQNNIFDVLRQKLHWGLDVRN